MQKISINEASKILRLPIFLITDFVSFEFNGIKLQKEKDESFDLTEIKNFNTHLDSQWDISKGRPAIPDYVQRYLIIESENKCSLCREAKPNYEYAHVRSFAKSKSHNPHNIVRLCLDCHRQHGDDTKLLRALKEENLKRLSAVDKAELFYQIIEPIEIGDAVYCQKGQVYKAIAEAFSKRSTGFVSSIINKDFCIVQRTGVIEITQILEPGKTYFLSPSQAGKICIYEDGFNEKYTGGKLNLIMQEVGIAEDINLLAIHFGTPIRLI